MDHTARCRKAVCSPIVPCGDNGVRLRQDDFGVRLDGLGLVRGKRALDGPHADAGLFGYTPGCALYLSWRDNSFRCVILSHLFFFSRDLHIKKLCVAPDMCNALLFGQVEPVKNATLPYREARRLRKGEAAPSAY